MPPDYFVLMLTLLLSCFQLWLDMTGKEFTGLNEEALAQYPESDTIPDAVRRKITVTADKKTAKSARGGRTSYAQYGPEHDPVVRCDYTPDPDQEDTSLLPGGNVAQANSSPAGNDNVLLSASAMIDPGVSTISESLLEDILTSKLGNNTQVRTVNAYAYQCGQGPINDYKRSFWFGCFPDLYPRGIGMVNDERETHLTPPEYFQHVLKLADPRFRLHSLFAPIAWNVSQRHRLRYSSQLSASRGVLDDFAAVFSTLSEATVKKCLEEVRTAEAKHGFVALSHIQSEDARTALRRILQELRVINARLPLTRSSKIRSKEEMYSLMLALGAPDLFVTVNPCDVHSPLLCTLAGVKLKLFENTGLYGNLPTATQRALLAAQHPYEAARFAYAILQAFCRALLGFGSPDDAPLGVFGKVQAYYLVPEEQGRGALHFHGTVWLANKPPPAEFEHLLKTDTAFQKRILRYLESIINNEEAALRKGVLAHCEIVTGVRLPCLAADWSEYERAQAKQQAATAAAADSRRGVAVGVPPAGAVPGAATASSLEPVLTAESSDPVGGEPTMEERLAADDRAEELAAGAMDLQPDHAGDHALQRRPASLSGALASFVVTAV